MFNKDLFFTLPKAELHLHLEGTLEPEMMLNLAHRNQIALPFKDIEAIREAYKFTSLQDFLDIYYQGASVLITEQDFYDLTWAYLLEAKRQNIIHVEPFFDPQSHTARGIDFATVIMGITKALKDGEAKLGITYKIVMCFLRHLSQEDAFETLNQAKPYIQEIYAVGLDSGELGNPPSKFEQVFQEAKKLGLVHVCHAAEEAPVDYLREALAIFDLERIDHGVRIVEDEALMAQFAKTQMPFTVCPLSNVAVGLYEKTADHPVMKMLRAGLLVTVNSDDPAYFYGYMDSNFEALSKDLGMSDDEMIVLCRNSIQASFMDDDTKAKWLSHELYGA